MEMNFQEHLPKSLKESKKKKEKQEKGKRKRHFDRNRPGKYSLLNYSLEPDTAE